MILTNEDITKISEIEKQPLIMCLNYLSYKKDEYEEQKRQIQKMKNKWNNT